MLSCVFSSESSFIQFCSLGVLYFLLLSRRRESWFLSGVFFMFLDCNSSFSEVSCNIFLSLSLVESYLYSSFSFASSLHIIKLNFRWNNMFNIGCLLNHYFVGVFWQAWDIEVDDFTLVLVVIESVWVGSSNAWRQSCKRCVFICIFNFNWRCDFLLGFNFCWGISMSVSWSLIKFILVNCWSTYQSIFSCRIFLFCWSCCFWFSHGDLSSFIWSGIEVIHIDSGFLERSKFWIVCLL